MDVVVWLRGLGLGKYEAAFRENEIDETVLPSLTHENLKELGVTALGHRLKLLDAIPLQREGTPVGVLLLRRSVVQPSLEMRENYRRTDREMEAAGARSWLWNWHRAWICDTWHHRLRGSL